MKYLCLLWLLVALKTEAGGDEVVVLYNSGQPESKAVAEHYATARQVPPGQIFGFALTTNEVISRAEFTESLQKPLAAQLETAGLWRFGDVKVAANGTNPPHSEHRVVTSKIRYAVLCYGMPLKIGPDPLLEQAEGSNGKPEANRDEAAVDSELTWLPLLKMNVRLNGPLPNPFYGSTNRAFLTPTNGILLVTRLDGPSAEIANHLVDKAMAAETTGLMGRAYFDTRSIPRNDGYYIGDAWLLAGAEMSRELGYDLEVDTNASTFPASYPMSHIALYAGWYDGDASGPFALPTVEFMPGAFAYHLHSFSADTLRSSSSHWCGPLLAKGATCTIGYVYEPYLALTLNVPVFLRSWAHGFTFGEAAWVANQALSWQTTVIGDPLYQPFKLSPLEIHAQMAQTHNPLIEWSFEQMVNRDRARGMPASQLEGFLKNLPATARSAVLTEKLAELYSAAGNSEAALTNWQQALKLNPSPEQRIRLRRILGPKLLAAGHLNDAIADYRQLLAESPEYPGRAEIEEELKDLSPTEQAGNKK
ncbi:MAG: TIGR03790 family protein [Verrucomicrobiae bacterium]|nr:TIGR03790 family protein [Verrucomicrobiae bacterium]